MYRKHNISGIISFVMGLFADTNLFGLIMVAGIVSEMCADQMQNDSALVLGLGVLILGCLLAAVFGVVLGIVGLFEPDRNRTFPILGTIFSSLGGVAVILLMTIGSTQP